MTDREARETPVRVCDELSQFTQSINLPSLRPNLVTLDCTKPSNERPHMRVTGVADVRVMGELLLCYL
jgi:hypothetical protein